MYAVEYPWKRLVPCFAWLRSRREVRLVIPAYGMRWRSIARSTAPFGSHGLTCSRIVVVIAIWSFLLERFSRGRQSCRRDFPRLAFSRAAVSVVFSSPAFTISRQESLSVFSGNSLASAITINGKRTAMTRRSASVAVSRRFQRRFRRSVLASFKSLPNFACRELVGARPSRRLILTKLWQTGWVHHIHRRIHVGRTNQVGTGFTSSHDQRLRLDTRANEVECRADEIRQLFHEAPSGVTAAGHQKGHIG